VSVLGGIQLVLVWVFFGAILALCLWAIVDCATRPAAAFPQAGKRTRGFWLVVLAAAAVVAFLALPLGFVPSTFFWFLAVFSAVAGIVYLVDVRPAVTPYSRRRGGRGPSGGPGPSGGRGPSRGGW